MLSYEDVGRSADWIAEAFGFRETGRWSDEDGTVSHVNMELDSGEVMLVLPSRDYQSPKHHAEVCEPARRWSQTPYIVDGVLVYVGDLDAHFARAKRQGRGSSRSLRAVNMAASTAWRTSRGTAGLFMAQTD